jgi:hypothetical protein
MDASEQRRSQRIRFTSKAILRYGQDMALEAKVDTRNISLHGIFLDTDTRIPLSTACDIEIYLTGATSAMDFHARGEIQRHDPVGMAVVFTHLDPDSYLHILNLVKLHEAT